MYKKTSCTNVSTLILRIASFLEQILALMNILRIEFVTIDFLTSPPDQSP